MTALEKLTQSLAVAIAQLKPRDGAELLSQQDDDIILAVLRSVSTEVARPVFNHFRGKQRKRLLAAASREEAEHWARSETYEWGTVGRMMEAPTATFPPDATVGEAVESIRDLVKRAFVTYGFVVDAGGHLVGIVTMRDLLLADRNTKLADVMLTDVFFLTPDTQLRDAMRLVLNRHFPVYPVCDADRTLVGEIRGQTMFEEQAFEISAQPGKMVGVDREERLSTPWKRSLLFRHPWLQLNLLTAFLAAAVVGVFQDTIDRIVILAMFLPVLAGQSGNTGCQALAVTLRGITLGELKPRKGEGPRHEGKPARVVERRARRGFRGDRDVRRRDASEEPGEAGARADRLRRDDRELCHQRHLGCADPNDVAEARSRPGDRVEHLPDDGDRHRQHGDVPRSGDAFHRSIAGGSELVATR